MTSNIEAIQYSKLLLFILLADSQSLGAAKLSRVTLVFD